MGEIDAQFNSSPPPVVTAFSTAGLSGEKMQNNPLIVSDCSS
jgi:hypothetical protein